MARVRAKITDLNDDCLIHLFQYLNLYDLYAMRDAHSRFTRATGLWYDKLYTAKGVEFNYDFFTEDRRLTPGQIETFAEYFGGQVRKVRFDAVFMKMIRNNTMSDHYLFSRLKMVQCVHVISPDNDVLEIISNFEHVQEFEIKDYDWVPLRARWPHLKKLSITLTGQCIPNAREYLYMFLENHKQVQEFCLFTILSDMRAKYRLIETIVGNMRDLIALNLPSFSPSRKLDLIVSLEKLEHLSIRQLGTQRFLLQQLKRLKYLMLDEPITFEELFDIVEMVPTLTKLNVLFSEIHIDRETLDRLIEKRKLSPIHQAEILAIENRHISNQSILPIGLKRNEEYISCVYYMREVLFDRNVVRNDNYYDIWYEVPDHELDQWFLA